jgi:hypothetical protein
MKTILEQEKDKFWKNYIDKIMSKELQSLYREDIGKMRGAFEAGIRFMVQFQNKHTSNHNLDFHN